VNDALFVPKKLSFRVMVSKVRDRFRGLGLLLGLVLGLGLIVAVALCLQCFDAVGWAAGRASGL